MTLDSRSCFFIGLGKFSSASGLSRFLFVCFCVVLTLKGFTDLYAILP